MDECAKIGRGSTDMYGQYGSVQTRATQICITRPFEKFWSWCKNRANLTSRESLCNVWARFESYKSGPSLVDKVLIRWHQRRIKKMPLECDWASLVMGQAGLGYKDKGSHDHEPGLICGQIRRSLRRANHIPAFPILN